MSIKENIEKTEKNITLAAQKSGRKREDILLLAVTKTVEIERMEEAEVNVAEEGLIKRLIQCLFRKLGDSE